MKKTKGAKKYQYKASATKRFKPAKTITTKKTAASFKKLAAGKQYFKVRGQFKKGKKKVWGKWSSVKTATVKGGVAASKRIAIAYDLAGGTLPAGAKTSLTRDDPYYELPTPTRAGYQFDG